MTWWREGMEVTMALAVITRRYEGIDKIDRDGPWDVEGFKFKLSHRDVMAHGDEIEEQLWSIKSGLA